MRLAVRTLRAPIRAGRIGGALYPSPTPAVGAPPITSNFKGQSLAASSPWNVRSFPFSTASFVQDVATATRRRERESIEEVLEEGEEGGDIEGSPSTSNSPERDSTFASMKPYMSYPTWKALTVKPFGYKDMSEVQQKVLHLLPELSDPVDQPMSDGKGRDLLVKARTGTGKTIAFLVPAIERRVKAIYQTERGQLTQPFKQMLMEKKPDFEFESLDKHGRTALARQFATNTVGTLIISPTRELATQIANEAVKLHYNHERFGVQLLVGGASKFKQVGDWRRSRPDVVVATPGRIKDLIDSDPMIADAIKGTQTLVLDEADTLLELGFRDAVEDIIRKVPKSSKRNTMLFSATVSRDIREIARKSMADDYRYMDCVPEGEDNIHTRVAQYATVLDDGGQQLAHITRLIALDQLQNAGKSKIIIFGNTTKHIQLLAESFRKRELRDSLPAGLQTHVYEIHSQKPQDARFNTSDKFRRDSSGASILFTTDVSARGVDYPGTTRVIQVGAPSSKDQYTHRIGRTGRAGADGCGELVLLPIEAGFLHGNLNDLPVQTRTVQQLQDELEGLAGQFDEDPTSVVDPTVYRKMQQAQSSSAGSRHSSRGSSSGQQSQGLTALQSPLQSKVEAIEENAVTIIEAMDEDEVRGVFFSLAGFYVGHAHELRITKTAVIEGLQKWAADFGRLEREPFLSQAMMQKMGVHTESRGFSARRDRDQDDRGYSGGGGRDSGRSFSGAGGGRFSDRGGGARGGFGDRGRGGFSRGGRGGGRFGDRQSYGDREPRTSFSERPSYGDREARPSYGDREARPSYGDRDGGSGYRGGRGGSSFGRGRGRGGSRFGSSDRGPRHYGSDGPRGGLQVEFSSD